MTPKVYTLDFSEVKNYLELHFVIRKAFRFPDDYACNRAALWDGLMSLWGEPIRIEIIGLEVVEKSSGESASKLIELLGQFKHFDNDRFANDIQIEIVTGDTRTSIA